MGWVSLFFSCLVLSCLVFRVFVFNPLTFTTSHGNRRPSRFRRRNYHCGRQADQDSDGDGDSDEPL